MIRSLSTLSFRSLLAPVVLAAPVLVAQELTQFVNGTPANATQVNANFDALKTLVQAAQATANAAAPQSALTNLGTTVTGLGTTVTNLDSTLNNLTSAITVTAPQVALNRRLQFPGTLANRKVVLLAGADNDNSFYGFGVNGGTLRYQVDAPSSSHVFYASTSATSSAELMRIQGNGNVGIGLNGVAPAERLDVAGSIKIRTLDRLQFGITNEDTDPIWIGRDQFAPDENVLELRLGDNGGTSVGNDAFVITSGLGNTLGGGTTLFQFNTQLAGGVAGQALKNGGGAWSVLSDARLKRDIQPLKDCLSRLMQLQGRTYYYNDTKAAGSGPGKHTGFVAQEVETVFPEWIGTTAQGMKTISITGFEALTVESIRELRAEKDAQIAALESDNADLKARLERIEAMLAAQSPTAASK